MSENSEVRFSVLGGEVASRYIGGISTPGKILVGAGLLVCAGGVLFGGKIGLVLGLGVWLGTIGAVVTGWGARKVHQFREWQRRRAGEHVFIGEHDPEYNNDEIDPGWIRPVPLGHVEPLDLTGTGLDDMFILYHHNPGEANYFSIVLSVQGLAEGLRSDAKWAQNMESFSDQLLNASARESSHIRRICMVSRAVPSDMTPHERWVSEQVANLEPEYLEMLGGPSGWPILSYGDVIDEISPHAEDHRCYMVVCIGESPALMKQAHKLATSKNAPVEGGVAQKIRDEIAQVQRALVSSGYGRVDVLGEQRACAVIRGIMNPSFPLERHEGVRWENCFPSYVGEPDALVIRPTGVGEDTTAWHTRVATVPPDKVAPVGLDASWLAPLLTGVDPDEGDEAEGVPRSPTIRTLAVSMDLVPARKARTVTRKHRTSDHARAIEEQRQGRIGDGTGETMSAASELRAGDLREGSGYHGVIWSMSLSVTGRDGDDCDRACARVGTAADESAITELAWRDGDHDIALFWTLPLGRGLASTRYTR